MSGKKASEVNTLLASAEKARKGSINILENAADNAAMSARKAISEAEKVEKQIQDYEVVFSEAAARELSDLTEDIKRRLEELKRTGNKVGNVERKYKDCDARLKALKAEYEENDKAAMDIRSKLKSKIAYEHGWYCDTEYRQANNVSKRYKELATEVNALTRDLEGCRAMAMAQQADSKSRSNELEKIKSSAKQAETRAEEIKQMREDAEKAREKVNHFFKCIDEDNARKFLPKEYNDVCAKVQSYQSMEDRKIIDKCGEITSFIEEYGTKLSKCVQEFERRRDEIKALLDAVGLRLSEKCISDAKDEFKNQGLTMMTLLEYLDRFMRKEYISEINELNRDIQRSFDVEEFDCCEELIGSLNELIDKAYDKAKADREMHYARIDIMLRIKKAMIEQNYKVAVSEDEDGYDIKCEAGDEIITLDTFVKEDGSPVINIDHQEATTGTCHRTWSDIRGKMAENGIIIEDIKKNGVSIAPGKRSNTGRTTDIERKSRR